jgi:phage tail sheath protein FI
MAVPDEIVDPNLTTELLSRCEAAKDRFAVLNEPTDGADFQAIARHPDSTYGALYYPRLRVLASHTPEGYMIVPPAGHITGIFARTDVDRGVHKAPANEVVRGIITRDLNGGRKPLTHVLSKREHDILNPRGVNVIRDFRSDGRDIRVWGARTMTSDAMWKYVNVRRLFIFLEQSIDRGTQWAVFEPNTEPTWIAIRTSITNFLRTVWRNGALQGTTQDEAFFVKCDRTTMTQDDIDNGRLICLIGVAPAKPAEFVIFRISQKTLEAES